MTRYHMMQTNQYNDGPIEIYAPAPPQQKKPKKQRELVDSR